MFTKWGVEEPGHDAASMVEEGGEVVFERRTSNGGTTWKIQPAGTDVTGDVVFGGEVDNTDLARERPDPKDGEFHYSVWTDKFVTRVAISVVLAGVLGIVFTVCASVLIMVCNDTYRNTLTTKDLLPMVTTFLQTAVTILIGVLLLLGFKRKDGG